MGTIGMLIGGLLALALGVIGIWTYVERGYVLSRGGERMDDAWAWTYAVVVLGGLALIGCAIAFYRRHSRSRAAPGRYSRSRRSS